MLPGRLLVGAYPSALDDAQNEAILSSILRLGCTTFVCLQQEYEHYGVSEYMPVRHSPSQTNMMGRPPRACVFFWPASSRCPTPRAFQRPRALCAYI